jgi:hypothetical protein
MCICFWSLIHAAREQNANALSLRAAIKLLVVHPLNKIWQQVIACDIRSIAKHIFAK